MVATSIRAPLLDDDLAPIPLRGDPNGLAYDPRSDSLYVADGHGGAIIRIDANVHTRLAQIESGGIVAANRLGGLAISPSGTLFVSRLGFGRVGAVYRVEQNGETEALQTLSPQFWRLGVAHDPDDDLLYSTQFMKSTSGPFDGSVVAIQLATGQTSTVLDGFMKPVGVAKLGHKLVVTDARQRAVYIVEMRGGRPLTRVRLTGFDRPDSICACGPDSVLITCYDEGPRRGSVKKLWLDGRTREIARGPWEPRGIATDGDRVFVSARRASRILVFRL